MQNGPKIALLVTAAFLVAIGVRVGLIYHANHEDGPAPPQAAASRTLSDDDLVFLKKERPDSLADQRTLVGRTLWLSAGGQMDYYRATANHVDYAHPVGTLPGATPIVIRGVFEQVAPHSGRAVFRIPAGQRHVLLSFTLPNSPDPKTLYAMPVGDYANGNYDFVNDEIFFYDDPHQLYAAWGAPMWQHIDRHEAVLGMSENQAMMALGEVTVPHGDKMGDRSVSFDDDGHPLTITFEHNHATKITPGN